MNYDGSELLHSVAKKEIDLIYKLSDSYNRRKNVVNKTQKKKLLTLLEKQQHEIKESLEQPISDEFRKLLTEFDRCISSTEKSLTIDSKASPFHLFQNSNLFLTSLVIYGFLLRKENHEWIIKLIDKGPTKNKLRGKLKDTISYAIINNQKLAHINNVFSEKPNKYFQQIPLNNAFLPSYSSTKKISGYRSELKRTLLKGNAIKFQDLETLEVVATTATNVKKALLLSELGKVRYNNLLEKPGDIFQLKLSSDKQELCVYKISENKTEKIRSIKL